MARQGDESRGMVGEREQHRAGSGGTRRNMATQGKAGRGGEGHVGQGRAAQAQAGQRKAR